MGLFFVARDQRILYDKISQERLKEGKQMKDIVIRALEDYFSK